MPPSVFILRIPISQKLLHQPLAQGRMELIATVETAMLAKISFTRFATRSTSSYNGRRTEWVLLANIEVRAETNGNAGTLREAPLAI